MSLTESENLFVGAHETGLNDLLEAFFRARPHLLRYRSSPALYASEPSSTWSPMPPIAFPGVPGGIDFAVQFDRPTVDLHPESAGGLPPELAPLSPGELSVRTRVRLAVACQARRRPNDDQQSGKIAEVDLALWGIAAVQSAMTAPGAGTITIDLRRLEIVDIQPAALEGVLECLLLLMLRAALATVRIPYAGLPVAGAFTLLLLRGPEVELDELQLYGNPV